MAIVSGACHTVAMIKGTTQRADNAQFDGTRTRTARLGETYSFPWGFNSQGAQHAMMWQHYMDQYGRREENLFAVPFNARRAAGRNPKAVFRTPMTFEDWWNSGYIAAPLRRLDYTIINDGGSCIILRRADMLADSPQHPVLVNGFSWATASHASGLLDRVADNYYTVVNKAATHAYKMTQIEPKDADQFQVYNAFSDILPWSLEACGHMPRGEAFDFMGKQAENIDITGTLPCMTSGGHQSEAYLLGWTQVVEAIRQARHDYEGTDRQVPDCNQTFYVHPSAEGPHTVLFRRG